MTTLATLKPADVITIDDPLLGGAQDMVISELSISPDLTVSISGRSYSILQEFADLSPAAIPVTEDPTDPTLGEADSVYVYGPSVFKFLTGSSTPVTSPITLTAVLSGELSTYDWEYWTGSAWANLSGTQTSQTYSLAYDNAAWGASTTLRVRCLSGTIFGEMNITKIYDGAAGTNGTNGVDAGNWSSTLVFTSVDYRTVTWGACTIYTAGTSYSISSGTTGAMAASTPYYLYLKPSVSTTVLQVTTTASDAVGAGQILVGVAHANPVTTIKAQFQAFGGRGGVFINADNIAANCIAADKIVANSITGTQINAGSHIAFDTVGKISFGGTTTNYIGGTSSTIAIYAGAYVQGYFNANGGITFNASASYMDISLNAGRDIELDAANELILDGGGGVWFRQNGSATSAIGSAGIYPGNTAQVVGQTGANRWGAMYATVFYSATTTYSDDLDDLQILHNMRPLVDKETKNVKRDKDGRMILDLRSAPSNMTNYNEVKEKIKSDNCDRITYEEIDELLHDDDELGDWVMQKDKEFIAMCSGAVRQLDIATTYKFKDQDTKFNEILNRLDILEAEWTIGQSSK